MGQRIFEIGGETIRGGARRRFYLKLAKLYDFTEVGMPVEVVVGKEDGPVLFVTAAVHGDEINGVEIARRLLHRKELSRLKGTLIVVPIVNVFGFNDKSRYLPDRRDLNRSFPGSLKGSMASQLAYTIMQDVVKKATHGIDLHTGAIHRTNLPHIRACLEDRGTKELANAFGVPLIMDSKTRDGSLREAARELGIPMLLFEGGEALRFDSKVIQTGLKGCLSVMAGIGMIPPLPSVKIATVPYEAKSSFWVRAPHSGCMRFKKNVGQHVKAGQVLCTISDPFDRERFEVVSDEEGIVLGRTQIPLVNRGDALFHIATMSSSKVVSEVVEEYDY